MGCYINYVDLVLKSLHFNLANLCVVVYCEVRDR